MFVRSFQEFRNGIASSANDHSVDADKMDIGQSEISNQADQSEISNKIAAGPSDGAAFTRVFQLCQVNSYGITEIKKFNEADQAIRLPSKSINALRAVLFSHLV